MRLDQGFTLIELLIAMTISSVVLLLAYQTLNETVLVESRLHQHQQTQQGIEKAITWFEQDLGQMAPRSIKDALGGTFPAFQYREDIGLSLSRFAQGPSLFETGGIVRVDYRLNQGKLKRRIWPVLDQAPGVEPVEMLLLEGVRQWQWRFLDASGQWQTRWPVGDLGANALPLAVSMILEIEKLGRVERIWLGPGAY
ncbi:type II secretion system minor pseudopilin GspJ [Thiomicrospira sp. WB1]|uniref:type II secretion system minor pseudopilin GspJ n=1 Tax=Thiomicrospira sp. WB1 TaxID=1685380 RepID=UPI0013658465|nr:type II secretion system minor pseudopilin GspJ [Thiomicrospira sp. WB1]